MSDPDTALEKALGLHEEVSIIYVVDGYEAKLLGNDGGVVRAHATGPTILAALAALDEVLDAQR